MPERVPSLIVAVREMEATNRDLVSATRANTKALDRSKKYIVALFVLLLIVGYNVVQNRDAIHRANRAQESANQVFCAVINNGDVKQRSLWEFAFGLKPTAPPSAEELRNIELFRKFIDLTFQANCVSDGSVPNSTPGTTTTTIGRK